MALPPAPEELDDLSTDQLVDLLRQCLARVEARDPDPKTPTTLVVLNLLEDALALPPERFDELPALVKDARRLLLRGRAQARTEVADG